MNGSFKLQTSAEYFEQFIRAYFSEPAITTVEKKEIFDDLVALNIIGHLLEGSVHWATIRIIKKNPGITVLTEFNIDYVQQSFQSDQLRREEMVHRYSKAFDLLDANIQESFRDPSRSEFRVLDLPKSPKVRAQWKKKWKKIKYYREEGKKGKTLAYEIRSSMRTMYKIIKAGEAGFLD